MPLVLSTFTIKTSPRPSKIRISKVTRVVISLVVSVGRRPHVVLSAATLTLGSYGLRGSCAFPVIHRCCCHYNLLSLLCCHRIHPITTRSSAATDSAFLHSHTFHHRHLSLLYPRSSPMRASSGIKNVSVS